MLLTVVGIWRAASAADVPAAASLACMPLPPASTLQAYTCGSLQRAHVFGQVLLASQPAPADLPALQAGGIRTVVNLRGAGEQDWDEGAQVRELGITYANPGFSTPAELTDDIFAAVRALLNDPASKPLLMHCASANRVGALWLAHRVLDGGLDYASALQEAQRVGLSSPELEQRAQHYISRQPR